MIAGGTRKHLRGKSRETRTVDSLGVKKPRYSKETSPKVEEDSDIVAKDPLNLRFIDLPLGYFPHSERIQNEFEATIKDCTAASFLQKEHETGELNKQIRIYFNQHEVANMIRGQYSLPCEECVVNGHTERRSNGICKVVVISLNGKTPPTLTKIDTIHDTLVGSHSFLKEAAVIYCIDNVLLQNVVARRLQRYLKERGAYLVALGSKPIRAAICYLIEKPIRDYVAEMIASVKKEKKQRMSGKDKNLGGDGTRMQTRSMTDVTSNQNRNRKTDVRTRNWKRQLEMKYENNMENISALHYKLQALLNEIMKEPGCSEKHVQHERKLPFPLKRKLESIKEVVVFGYMDDSLEVWLDSSLVRDDNQKQILIDCINETTKEFESAEVRFMEFSPAIRVRPGDKLYPCQGENRYGTVGTFAKSDTSEDIVAVTMEHVLLQNGRPYVDSDSGQRSEIGRKIEIDTDSQREKVVFVRVNQSHRENVSLKMEHGGRIFNSSVHNPSENLFMQAVYKKGARSGWSQGVVIADKQPPAEQGVLVQGESFARGGDSGSAVFRFEPNDPDDTNIEVISILSGDYSGEGITGTMTYRLHGPLQLLSQKEQTTYALQ